MFGKWKLEELEAPGIKPHDNNNSNKLFKLAVAEWTQLTDAQRKHYVDNFKVRHASQISL